jgi:hypothetical protein
MRTQTSKAKSQQLNTHQKNLETEPLQLETSVERLLLLVRASGGIWTRDQRLTKASPHRARLPRRGVSL